MIFRLERRIVLLKLAAIGDVAIACQALREFERTYETGDLELHWIIDEKLLGLARALLRQSALRVEWHPVSAARIFQGSLLEKAREAARIFLLLAGVRPAASLLFHRDRRYFLLFRAWPGHRIFQVIREELHEQEAYSKLLSSFAKSLGLAQAASKAPVARKPTGAAISDKIGVLIGGAQNSKMLFAEKRWPRTGEFIADVLKATSRRIVLFGGPEDRERSEELIARLSHQGLDLSRIESFVGKLPLDRLPAEMSGLRAFVSVDSGLAHIAASVMDQKGQTVVTLFGPTAPQAWRPRAQGDGQAEVLYLGAPCSPCYKNDGHFRPCQFSGEKFQYCMTSIASQDVLRLLQSI